MTASTCLRAVAALSLAAMCLAAVPAAAADLRRFDRSGIAFSYPSHWHVTTARLSNGINPDYRFAVSTVPIRRTKNDLGPCLPGIASQLPRDGALVYLREALGSIRAGSLPRMPDRPRTFPLPRRSDRRLCGFDGGGLWFPFRQRERAFYLAVYVGPAASAARRSAVRRLLAGLTIRAR
jgi:hypothetical protein